MTPPASAVSTLQTQARASHGDHSGPRCASPQRRFLGSAVALVLVIASLVSSPAFAQADAVRGKKAYETSCSICHSLTANGIGPSHKGVYGRKAGSMAGYDYSPGFAKANLIWDEKTLDAWIAFPENLVPGQKMGFYVMEADVRADIIAYLKSLAAPGK